MATEEHFEAPQPLIELPFAPLTKSHIIHCSYHNWYPKYRAISPKARLIPLTRPFLDYLRADGIVIPPDEDDPRRDWSDSDSGIFSASDTAGEEDDDEEEDPSAEWRNVHRAIKNTIAELGGKVVPKLNWSAPKDATWIAATNSMECRLPSDIYLLLKSSDFVTHDLEHAYDDCIEDVSPDDDTPKQIADIPYHLVLRKFFQMNPSVEFRCFVRNRKLIALCQRDLNHFDFLFRMQDKLRHVIHNFFDDRLKHTFPDDNFVFDVYVPPPHDRVWLIDVNPWAVRTDPLLFSWLELLTLPEPPEEKVIRIPIRPANGTAESEERSDAQSTDAREGEVSEGRTDMEDSDEEEADEEEADEEIWVPEFRLIRKDDPEAYSFNTPQYSAHKLPRDVVDASQGGPGALREFADNWKEMLAKQQQEDAEYESSEGD
ncbi:hypothetical protein JADG_010418 [Aureobasidium aubasidani]|nr:hypothetical protein JADG_010418 [Aureobasidium pullulans]